MDKLWQHQEQWAEQEAKFWDRMAADMRKAAVDWAARGGYDGALECSHKATAWSQVADGLRRPAAIRLERETYEVAQKPKPLEG